MSWNILPKNVLQYFLTKLKGLMYTKTEVDNLIPDSLSDLSDDATHRLVTDTEKTAWSGKSVVSANPQSTTGTLSGLEIDGVGYAVQGGDVSGKYDKITQSGVGSCICDGQSEYFKIATLTITETNINGPIGFEVSQTFNQVTLLQIGFAKTDNTDPDVAWFYTNQRNNYWIVKENTSVWGLYGQFENTVDGCSLHRIVGYRVNNGVTVTVNLTNVSALPSGATQPTYGGSVNYANIANRAVSATDSTKVAKAGDSMSGPLLVNATGGVGSYDEGIRINAGKNGYATLCIGGGANSTSGTAEGQFWIGTNPTNASYKRKLYIAQNGSTGSGTYFEADSASRVGPALHLGWSGSVADGNSYAVTGDVVYDYITSHMLSARSDVSGNMNGAAGFGNSMGMINLSGTDETVNPNGGTGWHHFINMSYKETSGSNMWQTQLACKAGTSDIFVRSRSGGSVTAGTAWAAPWIRLVKSIQRVAKSCNWMPGKNGVYFEEYTAGSNYNLPSNAWYHIISMQGADTKYGTQLALGMTTEAVYYRKYDNKTWGSWKSLINTNTTYSANNGVGLSGTTFYNSGVRDISINGNYLRKNVNGTNTDLTIPYATSAGRASTAGKADYAVYLKNDNGNNYCTCVNNIRATLTSVNTGVELRTGTSANWYLSMQGDGNLVVYQNTTARWNTGTSSRRFKHNIQTMTEERAKKILDIRPVTFDWNDDQPITTRKNDNAGVIAEEVSKIFPDLVVFEDIVDENGNRKTSVERRVEYERFTPYLIKMVQMQQEEINLLKKRIDILEGK